MAETRLPETFGTVEVYDDLSAAADVLIGER
jgi:hypothetical protein